MEGNVTTNRTKEADEIDLIEVGWLLLRRAPLILLTALLFAMGGYLYSKHFATPRYESSTKLYVLPRSGDTTNQNTLTQQDLQIGSMISKDYEQLVKTRDIAQQVIARLDLRDSNGEYLDSDKLLSDIKVSLQDNSRVVTIRVENSDPYMAHDIAEAVSASASEHIRDVTNSEAVNIVDRASTPRIPSSPNVKKNMMIAGMLGLLLAVLCLIAAHLSNDSIKNSEDIERYLQLPTLGVIPISKEVEKGRQARIRRRRELGRARIKTRKGK